MQKISTTNDTILSELNFLIALYLNQNDSFKHIAKDLIQALETNQLLPKRYDWTGNTHLREFNEIIEQNQHIPPDFLLRICNQLRKLFDLQLNNKFTSINSLLGCGQYSLLQDLNQNERKQPKLPDTLPKHLHVQYSNCSINLVKNLAKTQLNGLKVCGTGGIDATSSIVQPEIFKSSSIHKRILGHLAAVYCVCFDRTGRYILTGADDNLIKIWSSQDARLLATLRGHEKEISDIDVNFENTLLVSGSCDKSIRVWNMRTTETMTVLQGHTAMVTSVEFSPNCRSSERWMASSGNDGAVCFWQWNVKTLAFNSKPKKFVEKSRSGAQMLCISFSTGGSFLAAGSNDHVIRVYYFEDNQPIKICELESHTNFVDSIQYSNHSTRFLSGSKDGTARIWKYESKQWKALVIDASKSSHKIDMDELSSLDIYKKYNVTMVTWNSDDSMVVTAQNNYLIKVWNSNTAHLIHELKGHTDEVFVLEAHPRDPRIVLTAGHDGYIIIWNIYTGKLIRKFYNKIENEGHGCLFDAKWSPLLDMFTTTDSHGYLTLFGFGSDDTYKRTPSEQFFHTDYRPLMRDANDYVIDEQTGQPPHLMAPPFLVNADGNPYGIDMQRLVPGRENSTDAQLNPHIVVNERGEAEIIGDMETQEGNQLSADDTQLRVLARRRNQWRKNVIQPLDEVLLKTSEAHRVNKFIEEEEYIYREYTKKDVGLSKLDDAQSKRGGRPAAAGARSSSGHGKNPTEIVCTNRLQAKALYDTDEERANTSQATMNVTSNSEQSELDVDALDNVEEEDEDVDSSRESDCDSEEDEDEEDEEEDSKQPSTVRTRSNTVQQQQQNAAQLYDEMDWNSENNDSSEYSDWEQEVEGRKALKPPPRNERKQKQQRGSRKNKLRIKEEDEEIDIETADEEVSRQHTRRTAAIAGMTSRRTRIVSDDDDEEEDDDDEACVGPKSKQSTESPIKKRGRKPTGQFKVRQKGTTPIKDKKRLDTEKTISKYETYKECPPEYRPPEWLTSTKPRKSPYVPQMGDEVVYFRQGHEIYVENVKQEFDIEERSLPWNTHSSLDIVEYCKVIGLKVEIKPPRLVCLKLKILDKVTGERTGSSFSVKYHDIQGVVDFIILKQIYDRSMEKQWKVKDRFRCIIDDNWYFGTIESKEPFDPAHPDSPFQCFNVLWDSEDKEKLSPWDLEVVGMKKSKSYTKGEGVPVTSDDIKQILYVPDEDEWSSCGRDAECDRILAGLEKIMELSLAEYFNFPVDLDSFPIYAVIISYPIDLNTIKERLENRYYRRINSIQWDVRLIENNAVRFNEPTSEIVRQATFLTDLLLEFISDPNCTNPIPIYKRRTKNYQLSNANLNNPIMDSNEEHTVNHEETSSNHATTSTSRRHSRATMASNGRRTTYHRDVNAWKDDCKRLLERIMTHSDSEPFRGPVDLREFPDYKTIIKEPIDFSTIRVKLLSNEYDDLRQFDMDCKLVLANSKAYNTNKRSRIYGMTLRLAALYEARIRDIMVDYESAMKYKAFMTSRYGRKIKLRYGDTQDIIKETINGTGIQRGGGGAHGGDVDSDDARHGFDDHMPAATTTRSRHMTNGHTQPSTSTNSRQQNFATSNSANTQYATRSSLRLRTSQSTTFASNGPTTASHQHMSLRRSATTFEKSYYNRDVSDDEDEDNLNDHDDEDVSRGGGGRHKATGSHKINHVIDDAEDEDDDYDDENENSVQAAAATSHHPKNRNNTKSSILHESYVNGTMSSQNTSNDASSYLIASNRSNNKRSSRLKVEDDDEQDDDVDASRKNGNDSDPEYENKPNGKKRPHAIAVSSSSVSTVGLAAASATVSTAKTSKTHSRTRSSKRNRKQINKSYKEVSSSSNNDDDDDENDDDEDDDDDDDEMFSDTSSAMPKYSKKSHNSHGHSKQRKKQRRISSSYDECDNNHMNGSFNEAQATNSASNSSLNDLYENHQTRRVSSRGRPLKTVVKANSIHF